MAGKRNKNHKSQRKARITRLDRNTKVLCGCGCGNRLSNAQSARHMRGLAPSFIAASSARRRAIDLSYIRTGSTPSTYKFVVMHLNLTAYIEAVTAFSFLYEHDTLLDRGVNNEENIYDTYMASDDVRLGNTLEGLLLVIQSIKPIT